MPAPVDSSDPFRALADPKRRAILDLLAAGPLPVRAIAAHFPEISRPAVSKHLRMLREGGLVIEERSGRERYYSIVRKVVEGTLAWLRGVQGEGAPGVTSPSGDRARAGAGKIQVVSAVSKPRPEPPRRRSAAARERLQRTEGTRQEEPARAGVIEAETDIDDWKAW